MPRWITVAVVVTAACSSPDQRSEQYPADAQVGRDASVVIDAAPVDPTPIARLPDIATPLTYDLRLEIDPATAEFRGKVEIAIKLSRATDRVFVHAENLVIATASYRNGTRTGALTDLAIANEHDIRGYGFGTRLTGDVTLVFDYTGQIAKGTPEGLFRQQQNNRWYAYAQSESLFARRILPCFDEPRWKPTWRVTLIVPGAQVGLGNGAVVDSTKLADGRKEVHLAEVAKMPSYLLAVAVGPFAIVDAGKVGRAGIPARVVVPVGDERKVGVVTLKLPSIVDALETYLDSPMPIAKLDLVAVPRFFGAMENIGLVTFESSILVGDPKKPRFWKHFIQFTSHELAHQWFGNAVTEAWWDDLWLAEGFATWLGDKVSDQLGGYNDPSLRRQLARLHALDADDEATPRPLRRPIDAKNVDDRFDAIAYDKGGAVLEMLEAFAGEDVFREAMRGYVRSHAGGSATSKDVIAALQPTAPGAASALTSYLDMAGAPTVTIRIDCAPAPTPVPTTIALRAAIGTVPVCVRYGDGTTIARACAAATPTGGSITVPFCPAWVIGNAGGEGYYHVADPGLAAKAPVTPSEQLAYSSDLAAAFARGELSLSDAITEIRSALARDPVSRLGAVAIAQAIDPLVEDALRPAWVKWLAARFTTKRFAIKLAVPAPTLGAIEAEAADRLGELFDRDTGTKAGFDKIIAGAKAASADRQDDILEYLGEYGSRFAVRLVELYVDGTFKPSQVWPAVAAMLERPDARTATWHALRDRMTKVIATVSAGDLDHLVEGTRFLCDPGSRGEVVAAFTTTVKDAATKLAKPLAKIDRCIARRATIGDLAAALR